jgi:RimJ/RimL family protein N-acetyltransferase
MGFAFKEIATERLVLRSLRPTDAEVFFQYRSKPEISGLRNWKPRIRREILKLISRQKKVEAGTPNAWIRLAVCLKGTGTMIGDCGIRFLPPDARQAEAGFTIEPRHRGKGYATETVRALLGYAFGELHAHRVCVSVDPANEACVALMKRVGLRLEAHFRRSLLIDGTWADDLIFAMLEEEWSPPSN